MATLTTYASTNWNEISPPISRRDWYYASPAKKVSHIFYALLYCTTKEALDEPTLKAITERSMEWVKDKPSGAIIRAAQDCLRLGSFCREKKEPSTKWEFACRDGSFPLVEPLKSALSDVSGYFKSIYESTDSSTTLSTPSILPSKEEFTQLLDACSERTEVRKCEEAFDLLLLGHPLKLVPEQCLRQIQHLKYEHPSLDAIRTFLKYAEACKGMDYAEINEGFFSFFAKALIYLKENHPEEAELIQVCSEQRDKYSVKKLDLDCKQLKDHQLSECLRSTFEEVYLYNACITDQGLKSLSCMTNLRILTLQDCNTISDKGIEWIGRELLNLTSLNLSYNQNFSNDCLSSITKLPLLEILKLSFCNWLSDEGIENISKSSSLKHLDISLTRNYTDIAYLHLGRLTNLTNLDLRGGSKVVKDNNIQALESLVNLKVLNLSGCSFQLGYPSTLSFAKLIHLEELHIPGAHQIGDAGVRNILSLRNLKILDLSHTNVSATAFKEAESLPPLTHLYIDECRTHGQELVDFLGDKIPVMTCVISASPLKLH